MVYSGSAAGRQKPNSRTLRPCRKRETHRSPGWGNTMRCKAVARRAMISPDFRVLTTPQGRISTYWPESKIVGERHAVVVSLGAASLTLVRVGGERPRRISVNDVVDRGHGLSLLIPVSDRCLSTKRALASSRHFAGIAQMLKRPSSVWALSRTIFARVVWDLLRPVVSSASILSGGLRHAGASCFVILGKI